MRPAAASQPVQKSRCRSPEQRKTSPARMRRVRTSRSSAAILCWSGRGASLCMCRFSSVKGPFRSTTRCFASRRTGCLSRR